MGETMRVSHEGLLELADQCVSAAGILNGSAGVPALGPSFMATAAAVSSGHDVVVAAAAALSDRATDTGLNLRTSARRYATSDGGSAEQIAAAGRSIGA